MCGIVGICGKQQDEWIELMNRPIVHRGPDDSGVFRDRDANASLAMRRLAIVDLESGQQPITTPSGRYTIIFNGEIYNAPELRIELEKKNVQFLTDHSDTEVVLRLYESEGENLLRKLNGMFAFVVFDRDRKTLFGARDHAGIKPLHYLNQNGVFAFASELKSLLALPFLQREINMQSLFHYMSLMYVPGEETIITGIKRLPAGHSFIYDILKNSLKIKQWWKPNFSNVETGTGVDLVSKVRNNLEKAIKRWTLADVSIGCSLSGGLDSSAIVGLLSKSGMKLKTYSLGFSGQGEKYWNELPRAAKVAKKWGTDHHELVLNPENLLDDLLEMVWHLDEPYAGGLPSWNVFKWMSKDVKVGLTGSGGDEMFGNYGKWKGLEGRRFFGLFSKPFAQTAENFKNEFFEEYYYFSDDEKRNFVFANKGKGMADTSGFLYSYFQSAQTENIRDEITYTDLSTQLPEEFLMMTDRFSMAHSLEARTPFLDREFMEFMLSIPSSTRTKPNNLKYLLRDAIADLLLRELVYSRKKGFVIPIKLWLRTKLRPLVEYLLSTERLKKQGIFSPDFYSNFVLPHLQGQKDNTNKIWAALMFQLWYHVYIERNVVDKPTYKWESLLSV